MLDFVAKDAADGADRRDVELVADAICQEFISDFPGKDSRILILVDADGVHHFGRGHSGL